MEHRTKLLDVTIVKAIEIGRDDAEDVIESRLFHAATLSRPSCCNAAWTELRAPMRLMKSETSGQP